MILMLYTQSIFAEENGLQVFPILEKTDLHASTLVSFLLFGLPNDFVCFNFLCRQPGLAKETERCGICL